MEAVANQRLNNHDELRQDPVLAVLAKTTPLTSAEPAVGAPAKEKRRRRYLRRKVNLQSQHQYPLIAADAELAGSYAGQVFENIGEMTLVREAQGKGDLRDTHVRRGQ